MSENDRMRMDFVINVTSVDEESRTATIILEPDPRRYEWKEVDGRRCLYDKFDNVYIPERILFELAENAQGMPIYAQSQMIGDAETYTKSRQPLVEGMLKGLNYPPTFEDKSEEFLESLAVDKLAFVIMSIDIVGSTSLAIQIAPEKYARLISIILYELSEVVPKFHGHVLKYTGDGLIAYFPEPSFITKNDLAIDCALTLNKLLYKALNPVLEENGYPAVGIRIGLDAGDAYVETIGSPKTKQQKDIIGAVVSLAAKIQSYAQPGDIYFGETVERNLHTMWRQFCKPVNLGDDWKYRTSEGNVYKVFTI